MSSHARRLFADGKCHIKDARRFVYWATQGPLQTVVSSSQSHLVIPRSFPDIFCKKFASFSSARNLSRFVTTRGTCFLCGCYRDFDLAHGPIFFLCAISNPSSTRVPPNYPTKCACNSILSIWVPRSLYSFEKT